MCGWSCPSWSACWLRLRLGDAVRRWPHSGFTLADHRAATAVRTLEQVVCVKG